MTKKFKYNRRSASSVEARAQQSASSREGFIKNNFKVYAPKAGDNVLRILPPTWDDADHYGFDVYVNYGIGPDNASYASLSKMLAQADPIAEERERALAAGDEDYAKSLRPNKRVLLWVIDRDKPEEGPMVWPAPWTVDRDLSLLCRDKRTGEILYIDDPEDGFDIEFTKTGTGVNTKYEGLKVARRQSPLAADDEQQDKWLDFVVQNPLPSVILYYDYAHIKKVFEGGSKKDKPDDGDDDSGTTSGSSAESSDVTFKELCSMSLEDLDAFCEDKKVHLFKDDFKTAEDMAVAICEILKIEVVRDEPPARTRERSSRTREEPAPETTSRSQKEEEDPEQKAADQAVQEPSGDAKKSRLAGLRRR